jgi:hypothetical protein
MSPQFTLLLLAFVAANLPWLSDKVFYTFSLKIGTKNLAWCLFELLILYFVVGLIAKYTEYVIYGQVSVQNWEFYAVTFSLFLVFSFPGFIYKILWKKH